MKELTIGRSSDNDIQFPQDPSVSRKHAVLMLGSNGFSIQDLQSSNGTFVNGNRIHGVTQIKEHDIVKVGNSLVPWMEYANLNPQEMRTQVRPSNTNYVEDKNVSASTHHDNVSKINLPNASGALVCGILGVILSFWGIIGVFGLILSIIAVALGGGAVSKYKLDPNKYNRSSFGTANAGMILGIIGLSLFILMLIIVLIALNGNF